jgi:hypothetical protein
MTTATDNGWTGDNDLGIAVREVGSELQVKAISADGHARIHRAMYAAGYAAFGSPAVVGFDDHDDTIIYGINSAHRRAFAIAISPIAEPQK